MFPTPYPFLEAVSVPRWDFIIELYIDTPVSFKKPALFV